MSICTVFGALNGSMAVAMHGRGKGSEFRLREPRKQEADMHKSAFHCLSFWRAELQSFPCSLCSALLRPGAPQLGVKRGNAR